MPKYYCDYCDAFLTHDSPSVRKTHNGGRKHKENVRFYYQAWMEQQAQKLIDATTKAFTTQRMLPATNPAAIIPPAVTMPRPFIPPMGIVRPQMVPPGAPGFFIPPVLPTGLPIIPPTTTGPGGQNITNGTGPALPSRVKIQPPD